MLDHIAGTLRKAHGTVQRIDDERAMANAAIARLSEINSPQAAAWAERLRSDPRRGLGAAQQYGGIAEVENSLRGAQVAGRNAGLSDLQRLGLRTDGVKGYAQATQAEGFGIANDQQRELANLGKDQLLEYWERTDPTKAKALREGSGGFDFKRAKELRKDYTKRSGNFETIRHFYEIASANAAQAAKDPANAGAVDFSLVQAYGKMLDPNSVVRNEEGKFIAESQSSTVQDAINRFARLFSAAGTLNPQARLNLMRQIQATYEQSAARQSELLDEMGRELDTLGAAGVDRDFAFPIGIQLSDRMLDISPWEEAAQGVMGGAPAPASDALPMPADDSDFVDGKVYQTSRGPARWDAKAGEFEAVK